MAGLLHLGNAKFKGEDSAAPDPAAEPAMASFRALFGSEVVEKSLCQRSMTTRGETVMINLSCAQAALARDALAKARRLLAPPLSPPLRAHLAPRPPPVPPARARPRLHAATVRYIPCPSPA